MTSDHMLAWRSEMGFTQRAAAVALGVSLATYQAWERGRSWENNRPLAIDRRTALACAALLAGLPPYAKTGIT